MKVFGEILAALALMVVFAAPAIADTSFRSTTTVTVEVDGKTMELSKGSRSFTIKENVARIDDYNTGSAQFLNFLTRQSVIVGFRTKTYFTVPFATMIQKTWDDRKKIEEALGQREQSLPSLPADQRALMAAQIESQRAKFDIWDRGRYQVRDTGERADVLGHQCSRYEGSTGGEVFQEVWYAEDIEPDGDYLRYFARGITQIDPQEYMYFGRANKFPVKVVSRYGKVTVTTEYTNITTADAPAEAFILPDDLMENPAVIKGGQ